MPSSLWFLQSYLGDRKASRLSKNSLGARHLVRDGIGDSVGLRELRDYQIEPLNDRLELLV